MAVLGMSCEQPGEGAGKSVMWHGAREAGPEMRTTTSWRG